MTIAARLREHMRSASRDPQAILTIAMDEHAVHCMTEDMLDEWFRSLSPEEKADIFDAHLGAPDISLFPPDRRSGARPVALNAIAEGPSAFGTKLQIKADANRRRGGDDRAAKGTRPVQACSNPCNVCGGHPSPSHAPSVTPAAVEVL